MPLSRYEHTGTAPVTGLANPITAASTSCVLINGTGYPTGAVGLFVIDIDSGSASEEKILCSSRSGNTITFQTGGRGYDGTAATAHSAASMNVTFVVSAAEVDDISRHIYGNSGVLSDDHTNYALASGGRSAPLSFAEGFISSNATINNTPMALTSTPVSVGHTYLIVASTLVSNTSAATIDLWLSATSASITGCLVSTSVNISPLALARPGTLTYCYTAGATGSIYLNAYSSIAGTTAFATSIDQSLPNVTGIVSVQIA
jgi:hypothetical protein